MTSQIYLVTFNTWRRRPYFKSFEAAHAAASMLSDHHKWISAEVLCWVLMPDHWHGLVQLCGDCSLSKCINRAKTASALRVNQVLGRNGQFWQDGFHDHALRREEDIKGVARYIVANPLRAGLVEHIADYPFWDAVWL